ncbi:MAG: cysteine desulfurase-like protein [Woeseiaceae bacterium]|nr:cysteine desulfurase-like protein [Woeseiaceae bacterium]
MNNEKSLDVARVRSEFPGLENGWTFFDNAGGTQILRGAVERLNEFLLHRNVQTGGTYAVSRAAAQSLAEGREAMRLFVNARRAEEIVFAPSSTVALQNLARSLQSRFRPGDEIVVTRLDHESNIGPWTALEAAGVVLRFWDVDPESCRYDLEVLDALMNERTKLVAVSQVSNIVGVVNPIADIAALVHERGALLCVDSVACAPHRALDVQALDVDFLVYSLYKVYGPHYAVMYGKYDLLAELDGLYHYFYGRDKVPAKLEPGNASYELAYSSTAIVDYLVRLGSELGADDRKDDARRCLLAAFDAITDHECRLGERLLAWLRSRSDCRVVGPVDGSDTDRIPIVSFRVDGRHSGELAERIDAYNIAVRFGDFHARRLIEYLGVADRGGVLRVSMVHYNSLDEVDALIDAFERVFAA